MFNMNGLINSEYSWIFQGVKIFDHGLTIYEKNDYLINL